jgi:hypothetical protein
MPSRQNYQIRPLESDQSYLIRCCIQANASAYGAFGAIRRHPLDGRWQRCGGAS